MLAEMCPSAVSTLGLILSTQELPGAPLVSLLLESPADRYNIIDPYNVLMAKIKTDFVQHW